MRLLGGLHYLVLAGRASWDDVPGAEIVLTTHVASEAAVQDAITTLRQMPVNKTVGSLLRVHEH